MRSLLCLGLRRVLLFVPPLSHHAPSEKIGFLRRYQSRAAELEKELKNKEDTIFSLSKNMRNANVDEAKARKRKAETIASRLRKRLEAAEQRIKRHEALAKEQAKKMSNMKDAYDKLHQLARRQEREMEETREETDALAELKDVNIDTLTKNAASRLAAKNPYYADFYKEQCKKLRAEKKELLAAMRRMMSNEVSYEVP